MKAGAITPLKKEDDNASLAKRLVNLPTLLAALIAVLTVFFPGRMTERFAVQAPYVFLSAIALSWLYFQYKWTAAGNRQAATDVASAVFGFMLVWEICVTKLDLLPFVFVPAPENVFNVYIKDYRMILSGFFRSIFLLLTGFVASVIFGVGLGVAVGWIPRLRKAVFPIAKAISTVPALIYSPYLVVMMPTFISASIFVIFCGTFWTLFMNMIQRVGTIDQRIINTARILNVKTGTMLFKIILPYSIPHIFNDMTTMLSISVMTLTVAEMIGAERGMGFYVRRSLDYANYTQAIAGIFFIAIVITALNAVIAAIRGKAVKWSY
ncbi:MAG: ABC transporter permease subunit [Spirochaetaceae bacterium]|jgi:NitT/TauT family transport system permease protein|nr:ABC transporter permease subunit [Spirochaetaceae bacterium]